MELKYAWYVLVWEAEAGSNRTFMELKFFNSKWLWTDIQSSNRTFMELKYNRNSERINGRGVLIVPLWNWNPRKSWGLH